MISRKLLLATSLVFVLLLETISPQRALALTAREEEDLAGEILEVIREQFEIIDDPVIAAQVERIGRRIAQNLPEQPFEFHFYVLKENTFNAFAIPAGHIFINSGLIGAMESEDELAGILSHEIAHVVCRHISQKIERSKKIEIATLAGLAAGILLGAGGAATAGQAVTASSLAAGQSLSLAYSREDEMQADQLGLKYLAAAGYRADGLLRILNVIRNQEWYGSKEFPTYLRTHPAVEDRIAYIATATENDRPGRNTGADFQMARNRLLALYGDETRARGIFEKALAEDAEDAMAHYGMGLILSKSANRQAAADHLRQALRKRAFDPFILFDLGRVYFFDGKYDEALSILESAASLAPQVPEISLFLGRTQMELGRLREAHLTLGAVVTQKPGLTEAYYLMGQTLGKMGNLGEAHYYLGRYYEKQTEFKTAAFHLNQALKYPLPPAEKEKVQGLLDRMTGKKRSGN